MKTTPKQPAAGQEKSKKIRYCRSVVLADFDPVAEGNELFAPGLSPVTDKTPKYKPNPSEIEEGDA